MAQPWLGVAELAQQGKRDIGLQVAARALTALSAMRLTWEFS
ncbi:hypothetical protein [Cupriavidus basilensis]